MNSNRRAEVNVTIRHLNRAQKVFLKIISAIKWEYEAKSETISCARNDGISFAFH